MRHNWHSPAREGCRFATRVIRRRPAPEPARRALQVPSRPECADSPVALEMVHLMSYWASKRLELRFEDPILYVERTRQTVSYADFDRPIVIRINGNIMTTGATAGDFWY